MACASQVCYRCICFALFVAHCFDSFMQSPPHHHTTQASTLLRGRVAGCVARRAAVVQSEGRVCTVRKIPVVEVRLWVIIPGNGPISDVVATRSAPQSPGVASVPCLEPTRATLLAFLLRLAPEAPYLSSCLLICLLLFFFVAFFVFTVTFMPVVPQGALKANPANGCFCLSEESCLRKEKVFF